MFDLNHDQEGTYGPSIRAGALLPWIESYVSLALPSLKHHLTSHD